MKKTLSLKSEVNEAVEMEVRDSEAKRTTGYHCFHLNVKEGDKTFLGSATLSESAPKCFCSILLINKQTNGQGAL